MDELENLVKVSNELMKKMEEDGQKALVAGFKGVFEAHPEMISFSWTQYTPYFNDGEACYFSVHEPYEFTFQGKDGPEEYERYGQKKNKEWEKIVKEIQNKFSVVEQLGEHMKTICGDHVRVTLYADKIEIEGYEHD